MTDRSIAGAAPAGTRARLARLCARVLPAAALVTSAAAVAAHPAAVPGAKRWSDADLVAAYRDLAAGGGLEEAIRRPTLPNDPPQAAFLEALAWYAAGTPAQAGALTVAQLDLAMADQVRSYTHLLKARVEGGESNDYPRTRTWKLIQKMTLLRDGMTGPGRGGRHPYPAFRRAATPGEDPWERAHTIATQDEFIEKVCRGSQQRPVLVKYGNTNCTQCMLFELVGSVKDYAESPARRGKVDVYKVWWGYQPDDSFTGRVRDPQRFDELAKAEGVTSSPYFVAYRDGRRYPCGDAFPDGAGRDPRLDACLAATSGDGPVAAVCTTVGAAR